MDALPHFPKPATVRGRILGALLRGEALTQHESLRRYGDFRLAAHVDALRKRGWNIATEMIDVLTHDAERHAEVARYSMQKTDIDQAGEVGREFAEAARQAEVARKGH